MSKKIIGFAGEMVSGKTTAATYMIENYGAVSYRFSTILRDVADRLALDQSRTNLAKLSTVLRENFGQDLLAKVVAEDVKNSDADVIVIDGVRRFEDIKYLKELPEFSLVYMSVDFDTRYERITKRRENADDATKTKEEFKADNEAEAEREIPELEAHAGVVVDNMGDMDTLYKRLDALVK
jgi:dephospho-CoA kinase